MNRKIHVLVIDSHLLHFDLLRQSLKQNKRFILTRACNFDKALSLIKSRSYEIILAELLTLSPENIAQIKTRSPRSAVVVLTAINNHNLLVESMKLGADDCLVKNRDTLKNISQTLENILEKKKRAPQNTDSGGMLSALSGKIKNITDIINDPSKNWLMGKSKIHTLEKEIENLIGNIKNMVN
ncbi:MAG TPA: hypothetical protein DDW49_05300 [Deltaproteobacteria bacterium]|nr:MAG: hypothetical protein A2048_08820 [Deltaproteobacteria bacterium GWA2_45_12]HBF12792.1 hypothetical protein [Deltaproteobacteria bacterium]